MSYQVIARKWRPQRFSDMVGQEHIARTLKNTIITGRIAHAYLFVGPRGIGKTTSARIFAKALNCMHPIDGEPCCQCSSCKAIADESSVDVIEIDAATHTQVDKAREICEDVLHLPISSKYKIYIIDEVHMLSKSAWNALLKTIEEPPAHAKFIFATTEVNKVLPTVISRCQRFDLRRIPTSAIAERLKLIAQAEKVNISASAIDVIAQAADGGMRDAQSLLDQLISFFGSAGDTLISEEQALNLFGLTAPAEMELLLQAIISNDRGSAIVSIHKLAEQGKNLETLFEEIVAWLRAILLCRILQAPELVLEDSPEKIAVYSRLARDVNPNAVQRLLESLSASGYMLRESINKQVFIESILLKAMRSAHSIQIEDLIARLNQIRKTGELDALNSVVPLYEMPVRNIVTTPESRLAPPINPIIPQEVTIKQQSHPSPEPPAISIVLDSVPEKAQELAPSVPASMEPPQPVKLPKEEVKDSDVDERGDENESEEFQTKDLVEPYDETDMPELDQNAIKNTDEELASVSPQKPEEETPVKTTDRRLETNFDPNDIWQKLIFDINDNLKRIPLAELMSDGTPQGIRGSLLTIAYDQEYEEVQSLSVEKELNLLTKRLQAISGDPDASLTIIRRRGLATPAQIEKKISMEELKRQTAEIPLVRETMDLFQGKLVDVHIVDPKKQTSVKK